VLALEHEFLLHCPLALLTLALRLVSVAEIELGLEMMNSTDPLMVSAAPDTPTVSALGLTIWPMPTFGGRANCEGSRSVSEIPPLSLEN